MQINYKPGTVFAVPLRSSGFAVGLVTRMDGRGSVIGVFFAPKVSTSQGITDRDIAEGLQRVAVWRFGDLGLIDGSWPVVGDYTRFMPEDWPIPAFVRKDTLSEVHYLATYKDGFTIASEEKVPASDPRVEDAAPDRLMGAGSVEIKLTRMLDAAD